MRGKWRAPVEIVIAAIAFFITGLICAEYVNWWLEDEFGRRALRRFRRSLEFRRSETRFMRDVVRQCLWSNDNAEETVVGGILALGCRLGPVFLCGCGKQMKS